MKYFYNRFDKDAKRFYRDQVQSHRESYHIANAVLISHYCCIHGQNSIRQYLQKVTSQAVMVKESCDVSTGLGKVRTS